LFTLEKPNARRRIYPSASTQLIQRQVTLLRSGQCGLC